MNIPMLEKVNWTNKGDWTINHQSPQKTLTDITPYSDFVQEIKALFEEDDITDDEQEIAYPEYTEKISWMMCTCLKIIIPD